MPRGQRAEVIRRLKAIHNHQEKSMQQLQALTILFEKREGPHNEYFQQMFNLLHLTEQVVNLLMQIV